MADANTLTCAHCTAPFPAPTVRRGKVQIYCGPTCRVAGGNSRRASTRAGRTATTVTNPRPLSPALTMKPPSVEGSPSDAPHTPGDRLSVLMEKAHSRGGIDA
jgi:hypothetical protein